MEQEIIFKSDALRLRNDMLMSLRDRWQAKAIELATADAVEAAAEKVLVTREHFERALLCNADWT